jgi:hypothetical protein
MQKSRAEWEYSILKKNVMCNLKKALIPQPLLPTWEKGSKIFSRSLSQKRRGI